jgi:RNA polymerase sigma factor (sigma-70 family)
MLDDQQLLRHYATNGSEAAFGELVQRYMNLVYSAALRRTGGSADLSNDITQQVFTDLARKARSLSPGVVLAGWLHCATRYAAGNLLRAERRRQACEKKAAAMNPLESELPPDWDDIRPVLDGALDRLGRVDRDALLLRFFENRTLAEVGHALGASEEAARKRVNRALDKLRTELVHRGLKTSAAVLSAAISVNAVQVAPAALAATLTSTSLAGVAAAGTTFSILEFTIMTKLQAGIISALVVAATVTPLLIQHRAQARLREKNQMLEQQADRLVQLAAENERLSNLVANASRPVANDQSNELLRLRGQMGALRRQTNELGELQEENRRLKQAAMPEVTAAAATAALHSRKAGFARNYALALLSYASENRNQFPTNFDQISRYLPAVWEHAPVPTSDWDGFIQATNQFEIVFHGSIPTLIDPGSHWGSVVVVRERQAWLTSEGNWAKTYGFADGHTETHMSTDGDFKRWDSTPSDGN